MDSVCMDVVRARDAILGNPVVCEEVLKSVEMELVRRRYLPGGLARSTRNRMLRDQLLVTLAAATAAHGYIITRLKGEQLECLQNQAESIDLYLALGHAREGLVFTAGRGPEFGRKLAVGSVQQPVLFPEARVSDARALLLVVDPSSTEERLRVWLAVVMRIDAYNNRILECQSIDPITRPQGMARQVAAAVTV